jgi:hypothetical protein
MKSAKNFLNSALLVLALFALVGCTPTIRPKPITAATPSYDGNSQNSGFIAFDAAGSGILTQHGKDRYDVLMRKYGRRFNPAVSPGAGITPTATNTFLIDREHLVYFATANRWFKEGK